MTGSKKNSPVECEIGLDAKSVIIQCATDIEMKSVAWLWDTWLASGKLTILAGEAGSGKTTITLSIASAVTTANIPLPDGSLAARHGNVLIWSGEDAIDDTLLPRLIASGAESKRIFFVKGMLSENFEQIPFDPSQDILALESAISQIDGDMLLLIVDPIVSVVQGDMHRSNVVRRSLQALVDFSERHGCAIIGITHFSKNGIGKSPLERVLGSQAFGALARVVWVAGKKEGTDLGVLARAKSNIGPDDGGFGYEIRQKLLANDIKASHVVWGEQIEGNSREILAQFEHSGDGERGIFDDAKQFLTDLLSERPLPAKQVFSEADQAGYSKRTIERAKQAAGIEAERRGTAGKKGGGTWYWCSPHIKTAKPEKHT